MWKRPILRSLSVFSIIPHASAFKKKAHKKCAFQKSFQALSFKVMHIFSLKSLISDLSVFILPGIDFYKSYEGI